MIRQEYLRGVEFMDFVQISKEHAFPTLQILRNEGLHFRIVHFLEVTLEEGKDFIMITVTS